MTTLTVTITDDIKQALEGQVKAGWFGSVSEALNEGAKLLIKRKPKLTVNGFTKEVEEEILRSEKSPVVGEWKNEEEIHQYFEELRMSLKKKIL